MVYDLTDHCINVYIGSNTWKNLCEETSVQATITSIDCDNNPTTFTGDDLISNLEVTGTSTFIRVYYAGGNEVSFSSESISSTNITGLTATVDPGTLANGDGFVDFIITGTPSGAGTATFPISFLGVSNASCPNFDVTVLPPIANIRCNGNKPTFQGSTNTLLEGTTYAVADNYRIRVRYAGGADNYSYASESIASNVITGLTATVEAGTLSPTGSSDVGTVNFIITGTPSGPGIAEFPISFLGVTSTCGNDPLEVTIDPAPPTIASIECGGNAPSFTGATMESGTNYTGTSRYIRVHYTGGNEKAYSTESIASTGILGLTATVEPGTLANGSGFVDFIVTGTPASAGTATFPISFLGISNTSCPSLNVTIDSPPPPITGIRCSGNKPTYLDANLSENTTYTTADNRRIRVSYANGLAGYNYATESIASTGITGLTATVAAGVLPGGHGTVEFIITGTPSGDGDAFFPISFLGVNSTCGNDPLAVTVDPNIVTPPTHTIGSVNLSTKLCFDVAETNDAIDGCGALVSRTPIEADFTQASTHTQTLTISTTSAPITDIEVLAVDLTGKVIASVSQPASTSLAANSSVTTTISYKQDLNTEASGLDHANRLTATIYVTYKEGGVDFQVESKPFVKDCACSQIESTNGQQHMFINAAGELYSGNSPLDYGAVVLGHSNTSAYAQVPIPVPANKKIIDVSYGELMAVALDEDGVPYVFGDAYSSGFGKSGDQYGVAPIALNDFSDNPINEPVIDIAVGKDHTVYLTQSLKIYIAGGYDGGGRPFTATQLVSGLGLPLEEVSLPVGSGSPIAIYADYDNTWVLDDQGDAYVSGRGYYDGHGFNANNFSGPSGGQHLFRKLQLGPSPANTIGTGISPSTDFPSPIINLSGTSRATAVLLANGDIYYAGENTHNIVTDPVRQSSATIGSTYTSVFGKLLMDGDATSMGQPIKVQVFCGYDGQDGGFEASSIIYVLDDKGDLYAKGSNNSVADKMGGWGPNTIQTTFKKLDLSAMGTEKIVNIKTNFSTTVIVSDAGKLYYTGRSQVIDNSSNAYETTFKAAGNAPATNTDWVK